MRVCVIQFETKNSREENVKKAVGMLEKALQLDPDLVVLPEAFNTGLQEKSYTNAGGIEEELSEIIELSEERDTVLVAGVIAKSEGLRNIAAIIHRGNVIATYAKVLLFPLTSERRNFLPGNELVICSTPAGKIGLAICYEIRFPEIARKLALLGAEILAIPSQFPRKRLDHWENLVKARAIENQLFVVAANSFGRSMVVDPWGRASIAGEGDCILVEEIELEEVWKIRENYPFLKDVSVLNSLNVRIL